MEQIVQQYPGLVGGGDVTAQRNRVLRNTYWLLALSMVPTVLGAWLGVEMGMAKIMGSGTGLIVFMVGAFGFMFAIEKTKNSAAGVPVRLQVAHDNPARRLYARLGFAPQGADDVYQAMTWSPAPFLRRAAAPLSSMET